MGLAPATRQPWAMTVAQMVAVRVRRAEAASIVDLNDLSVQPCNLFRNIQAKN